MVLQASQVVADGLDKSNGIDVLLPVIIAGIVIPLVFAWAKRPK